MSRKMHTWLTTSVKWPPRIVLVSSCGGPHRLFPPPESQKTVPRSSEWALWSGTLALRSTTWWVLSVEAPTDPSDCATYHTWTLTWDPGLCQWGMVSFWTTLLARMNRNFLFLKLQSMTPRQFRPLRSLQQRLPLERWNSVVLVIFLRTKLTHMGVYSSWFHITCLVLHNASRFASLLN